MNKNTAGKKTSILKKNENMTILFIFLGFLAAITILQLCMNAARGAVGFPNFISPSNLFNIMMQVACVGILTIGMMMIMVTGAIDLSVGMQVSLIAIFTALCISDWGNCNARGNYTGPAPVRWVQRTSWFYYFKAKGGILYYHAGRAADVSGHSAPDLQLAGSKAFER